jgi:hypothetical protein
MSEPLARPVNVVGVRPWLPWPLLAWSWWTMPLPAERLAVLRIGVTLCLLADIALNYAPETLNFFGKDGIGDPHVFDWRFQPPRTNWSLLRGVGDGAGLYLGLAIWLATTTWILGNSLARLLLIHKNPPCEDRTGIALVVWWCSFTWYVLGLWSRMVAAKKIDNVAWAVPLAGFSLVSFFLVLDLAARWRDSAHRIAWVSLLLAWLASCVLLALGFDLWIDETFDLSAPWVRFLRSWQEDDTLLVTATILWIGATLFLCLGCATQLTAVLTWLISMSFATANPYLDNAGDTIRLILLFYLMLCPCGAAWSVDALFQKRTGPVYVHPWPLRLIFVQMILIYFINGLYKLFGGSWRDGTSLHYVLGDLALTRFSQVQLPIPHPVTQIMTWTVMIWEVSFPLLVLEKWTRRIALMFGVLFHLGIFVTMELAGFVPYALCMYLPLLPWERLPRMKDRGSG